jgi:hypothetical protein
LQRAQIIGGQHIAPAVHTLEQLGAGGLVSGDGGARAGGGDGVAGLVVVGNGFGIARLADIGSQSSRLAEETMRSPSR